MPLLSYPTADFSANTLIRSSEVNGKFNAIKTLLNTTGLDSTNIQTGGVARTKLASGTANHVIINDASGVMSSEAALATSRGGLGVALSPSVANQVIRVNAAGTAFETGSVPLAAAPSNVFALLNFF